MNKKVSVFYILGGLAIFGWGLWMLLNRDFFSAIQVTQTDPRVYEWSTYLIGFISFAGFYFIRSGLLYPTLQAYPLSLFLLGLIILAGAAEVTSTYFIDDLHRSQMLLPLLTAVGTALFCLLTSVLLLPGALKQARKAGRGPVIQITSQFGRSSNNI